MTRVTRSARCGSGRSWEQEARTHEHPDLWENVPQNPSVGWGMVTGTMRRASDGERHMPARAMGPLQTTVYNY